MDIKERLEDVKARICAAAEYSGRDADEIKLIAVTKTHPPEMINEAIRHGVTDIGENKPQEIRDKFAEVLPVRWHMIGHLQANKIKYVIDRCTMIHSVDSAKLADEIDRHAIAHDRDTDILIQVNISGEATKSGIAPEEHEAVLLHVAKLKRTHVKGLMTIAPKAEFGDPDIHFVNMRALFDEMKKRSFENVEMRELSMGMSGDFEAAIRNGATMVRVGSAIFGARSYDRPTEQIPPRR